MTDRPLSHSPGLLAAVRRSLAIALLVTIATMLAMFAFIGTAAVAAAREPRLALVIANGDYSGFDKLAATGTDGDRVAEALSAAGFADPAGGAAVAVRRNLTRAQMIAEIGAFKARLEEAGPDAFGVLYFSGHGAALSTYGDVMMLPVDATQTLEAEATSLTRAAITKSLLGSSAKTVVVILDMCRNVLREPPVPISQAAEGNFVVGEGERIGAGGTKGLKRVVRETGGAIRPDQGYLVAFSTSADQVAFDNGTFSRVLAEEIRRPQQNIADALKRTSDRVAMSASKSGTGYQKPTFDYGLHGEPPCFVSCNMMGHGRFFDCANCPYMRIVPSGIAQIGSPPDEEKRGRDEPVQRSEPVDHGFAMGVYEVTVAEWRACVADKACRDIVDWSKENPNPLIPATGISHSDAQAYVAWLTVQSGLPYRLPTGTEWEYANRAGAATAFPWGDEIAPSSANYDQTAKYKGSSTAPYRGYPEAVNAYPPNAFGLYQMNGNVWELTEDCADAKCSARLARGGSFQSVPAELRSANRFSVSSDKRRDDMGLRVVRDLRADETM